MPSWFRQLSGLLPCRGERGRSGFDWRLEKTGGGGTEFRIPLRYSVEFHNYQK
uniref:large ribosomal subunit protein mL48 isoform 3 n=1 Tax=Rattus norvegicus TaxID=10116 RepID=UPI0030C78342